MKMDFECLYLNQPEESADCRIKKLLTIEHKLFLARDLDVIIDIVRQEARKLTGADGATFVLRDNAMCNYVDEDAIEPLWKGQRFPMESCISGWVMLNGQSTVIGDIYTDARIPIDAYKTTFVKSLVMVPIHPDSPVGAIGAYWAEKHKATKHELTLLERLAESAAIAIQNAKLNSDAIEYVKELTKKEEKYRLLSERLQTVLQENEALQAKLNEVFEYNQKLLIELLFKSKL